MNLKSIYRFISSKWQTLFLDYPTDFKPRYGHGLPGHDLLLSIIEQEHHTYTKILKEALNYAPIFQSIKKQSEEKNATLPTYNNGFLPGLDIISIYTIIATYKPTKYIEVGSGNSTKVAHKAIKDQGLNTKIVSIDPHPRAEIDQLANKIIREPFENTDYSELLALEENDILFIDNSHRILPNSDSTVFFLEILPKLKKGVIVHIHDIYLPYDYPQFMCDRFYSEQYGLAMYLIANPTKYKTLLPNYYISEHPQLKTILTPIWNHPSLDGVEKHGGSYWIQIN